MKLAVEIDPHWILAAMNSLLETKFPQEWKTAEVIFVLKKMKTQAFQHLIEPLYLMNTLSKLFEDLIRLRLLD